VAVGQYVIATVNGMGATGDTYQWTMVEDTADPFAGYSPSSTGCAAPTPFEVPSNTINVLKCYFGGQGEGYINCSYYSAQANASIQLTQTVSVEGPNMNNVARTVGKMSLLVGTPPTDWTSGSPYPTAFFLFDAIDTGHNWGMWENDMVTDPSFLTTGSGEWGLVQTVYQTATYNGTMRTTATGLDGGFPVPNLSPGVAKGFIPADGVTQFLTSDAPGWSSFPANLTESFTLSIATQLSLYIFYKPGPDNAGPSVYVPCTFIPWTANGAFEFTLPTTWSPPPYDTGSGVGKVITYPSLGFWPTW